MKTLAVTGVKGGVGKTTVATLLAKRLSETQRVLFFDVDVECPNAHLFLGKRLGKPAKLLYTEYPRIIKSKCRKCGACAKACQQSALFWVEGAYPSLIKENCIGCGVCMLKCPSGAIRMRKEVVGKVFVTRISKNLTLVTGLARENFAETGIVVKQAREFVSTLAKKLKAEYLVVDTSPGMHCNVIQALIDCDTVLLVTEPTPLGAHDLELALRLVKKLNAKPKVVVNKVGIGSLREIEKVVKKYGAEIVMKINYSESFAKSYARGKLEGLRLDVSKVVG